LERKDIDMLDSITFEIKPEHIREGIPGDCSRCMVALAIWSVVRCVNPFDVKVIDNEEIYIEKTRYTTRKVINELIDQFDKLGPTFTFAENYKPIYTLEKYEQQL
jgi:hypothetical protein